MKIPCNCLISSLGEFIEFLRILDATLNGKFEKGWKLERFSKV